MIYSVLSCIFLGCEGFFDLDVINLKATVTDVESYSSIEKQCRG